MKNLRDRINAELKPLGVEVERVESCKCGCGLSYVLVTNGDRRAQFMVIVGADGELDFTGGCIEPNYNSLIYQVGARLYDQRAD